MRLGEPHDPNIASYTRARYQYVLGVPLGALQFPPLFQIFPGKICVYPVLYPNVGYVGVKPTKTLNQLLDLLTLELGGNRRTSTLG